MDWSRLATISTFDDANAELIHNGLCLSNFGALSLFRNDPNELTTIKPTTSVSLLIEGLVQLICNLIEADNKNVAMSYTAICEKLNAMILIDDSYAWNEFADIRTYYGKQIYDIIRAVGGEKLPFELAALEKSHMSTEIFWSRYKREFDEVRFIAGGGYGRVYQARHKLDSIDYAVKQIKINPSTIKLYHFAEVKTIASLNHPNIVQYKSAWLEPILPKINGKAESIIISQNSSESMQSENSRNEITLSDKNSLLLAKYNSKSNDDYKGQTTKTAILYIQMALCKLTLQEWLIERNSSNNFEYLNKISHLKFVHNIFCQIMEGLNYIHSKNIIHHDIKPSNIFLLFDENDAIIAQLGDFGLACPLQDDHTGYPLGTKLYAAPEQLQGECNPKSDVYSLGIVLLELLIKYNTNMERVKIIENAKKGIFPIGLTEPSVNILKRLLSSKDERPTTREVLKLLRKINLAENALPHLQLTNDETEGLKNNQQKAEGLENNESLNDYIQEINRLKDEMYNLNQIVLAKNKEIKELRETLNKYES